MPRTSAGVVEVRVLNYERHPNVRLYADETLIYASDLICASNQYSRLFIPQYSSVRNRLPVLQIKEEKYTNCYSKVKFCDSMGFYQCPWQK